MAYAALVSLAQTIDQILNHDQYTVSLPQKQQIISIHKNVILLQEFLDDFVEKANKLEGRITDAVTEAEDIIEYIMCKQIRSHSRLIKSTVGPSKCTFIHYLRGKHTHDRHNNFHKLKKVSDEIESIAGEVMDMKNSFSMEGLRLDDSPAAGSLSRIAPAATKNYDIVGFDDDLMAIKSRLCGEQYKRQVIPIFGMGGIGKTTLARNAYDDPLTMQHFDIRAWITVSHDYSALEILSSLLVSMKMFINEETPEDSNNDEDGINDEDSISDPSMVRGRKLNISTMAEKVYKCLKGRRYLIVMDDMWSTKAWDELRNIFPDDNNGSRIILTTRLSDVAAYADPSSPLHEMHFMDVDQSWDLLQKKVFAHQGCPRELVYLGKEIARSCKGLPLAIVLIAGLLSTISKSQASWGEIARNVNSAFSTKDGQFEKILSLSYTHLPHHLRPCFLYMGGFPEDYEIHVSKLIKLWVAEGFLKPDGCKSLEERAVEYLEDLVKRSLVLVTRRKSNGKIKSCSVHDLVRDLCITKAEQEKFLVRPMDKYVLLESVKNLRRVSTSYFNLLRYPASTYGSTIHTIIYFQHNASSLSSSTNFRLLRVLGVEDSNVCSLGGEEYISLPVQLFELFHLRYLAFDYPTKIPAAISNFQNLQTLVIHPKKTSRINLSTLPLEIWRMPKLRHIICFYIDHLPTPQGATSSLESLQTLMAVNNFVCTESVLNMIPNLKKLGLVFSGSECDEDFHLENLLCLRQLEKLKLEVQANIPFWRKPDVSFPRMLKKLTLSGWGLPWNDMTIVGALPNLQVLKLKDLACHGDTWETIEGEFPELNFLLIDKSNLKYWITETSHFPSLKCLMLHHCPYLSEIPDGIGEIPTLELIEVEVRNKSLVESAKQIQEEQQESWGNDGLQVRCVQTVETPTYDWVRDT